MRVWFSFACLCSCAVSLDITIDGSSISRVFDGHGGLSAGASSRLLYDYEPAVRADILDYLYKPSFGAALSICKVEIGGDVQSTNGVEASHMHTSKDLNMHRGYEWWLMAEAKKRNPKVKTYVLSWGTPGWVGKSNGSSGSYFSDDNIMYQTAFVKGARDVHNITVDYLGIWNERPWGNVAYVKSLRAALDAAGLHSTLIVGSDGGHPLIPGDHIKALQTDRAFAEAEHIQGSHYPCKRVQPQSFWDIRPQQTYWSNEDFSTIGGDWAGGSCWGRSLSQNFVKLNATATISWSTIWSVYDSWRYFGNGLMYAMEPWSGNYTVPPAIWTSAHVNQFAEPGWHFLGGEGGNGLLPGGGSWTSMVPPASRVGFASEQSRRTVDAAVTGDFTLVVEKLEGACLRCRVPKTTAEDVTFRLGEPFTGVKSLAFWLTNATVSFVRMPDVDVVSGLFSINVPRDTIMTFSTTTGQTKGQASTCSGGTICTGVYKPFPFPYRATYDDGEVGRMAKFHADNGGAFEIRADADSSSGKHLLQASPLYPKGTDWAWTYDPITSLGATDWVNYRVSASVMLMAPAPAYAVGDDRVPFPTSQGYLTDASSDPISKGVYGGVCVRQIDQYASGFCLLIGVGLSGVKEEGGGWVLQGGLGMKNRTAPRTRTYTPGTVLAQGALPSLMTSLSSYHGLSLMVQGDYLVATIDGTTVARVTCPNSLAVPPVGQAALRSSFSYTQFDNFTIDGPASSNFPSSLFAKHLVWPPKPSPGGPQAPVQQRTDFSGLVGCAFRVGAEPVTVDAVARFAAAQPSVGKHNVSIVNAGSKEVVASAVVDVGAAKGGDLNGYAWAELTNPITLAPGTRYFLVSEEQAKQDAFFDSSVWMLAQPSLLEGLSTPVYKDATGWHDGSAPDVPLHYIASVSTGECLDTRDESNVDTWTCVDDGHNELFGFHADSGLIVSGPGDNGPGKCFEARSQAERALSSKGVQLPPTSMLSSCDAKNKNQVFDQHQDGTLRLRADAGLCLTSGPKGLHAGVLLAPCKNSVPKTQQWTFNPAPPSNFNAPEWGQSYGPLNLRLKASELHFV